MNESVKHMFWQRLMPATGHPQRQRLLRTLRAGDLLQSGRAGFSGRRRHSEPSVVRIQANATAHPLTLQRIRCRSHHSRTFCPATLTVGCVRPPGFSATFLKHRRRRSHLHIVHERHDSACSRGQAWRK